MALVSDRNTPRRLGQEEAAPVAAGAHIHAGGLLAINASGYAEPGDADATLVIVGMSQAGADNRNGGNGDASVSYLRGEFRWDNSSGPDLIGRQHIRSVCYAVDDHTVALTSAGGTRPRAGVITGVDDDGVWVDTGALAGAQGVGLVAANNLSDVGSASAARANLGGGANKVLLQAHGLPLDGTDVQRFVAPVAGDIALVQTVIDAALADGDATVTLAINGTPVTGGVVTIAQAGSAAGDVDSAAPSAARTVAVGDVITATVGGANSASATAAIVITITPSA